MTTPLPVPTAPDLIEDLRRICAETVEIPLDKVTADADLAADLGVDSLTMDELVDLLLERYGLADKTGDVQSTSYPTIGALAELIQQLSHEGSDGENT